MTDSNHLLTEALAILEKRLETPVVPGELPSWVEDACTALEEVERRLRRQLSDAHRAQLKEILRQDAGLAARVEQLRLQDDELLAQLGEVRRIADELRSSIDRLEPDERLADAAHAALVEKGLRLVIAARTQEAAIATWYVEAFDRDRGVVD